jgi:hypothetical protein
MLMPWWRSKEGRQKRSHFGPAASRRVNGALHRNIACKAAFERHRDGACSAHSVPTSHQCAVTKFQNVV